MKKTLVLLLTLFSTHLVYSQEFIGQKIKYDQWATNEVLTFSTFDGVQEIQMVALPKKVKKNKKKIRHLKINGDKYQLVAASGAINLLNADGKVLLKTNPDRTELFIEGKHKYVKARKQNAISYLDESGKIAVKGQLREGIIRVKNYQEQLNAPLLAICLEELLQIKLERDRANYDLLIWM